MAEGSQKTFAKAAESQNLAFGPQQLGMDINQLFQLLASSPAAAAMFSQAGNMANTTQSALATQLGRSGLQGTGVGRVSAGLGAGAGAFNRQQVLGQLFGQSQQMGLQNILARMQTQPGLISAQAQAHQAGKSFGVGDFFKALAGGLGGGIGSLLTGGK